MVHYLQHGKEQSATVAGNFAEIETTDVESFLFLVFFITFFSRLVPTNSKIFPLFGRSLLSPHASRNLMVFRCLASHDKKQKYEATVVCPPPAVFVERLTAKHKGTVCSDGGLLQMLIFRLKRSQQLFS